MTAPQEPPSSPLPATQTEDALGAKRTASSQDGTPKRPKVEVVDFEDLSPMDIEELCADDFNPEDDDNNVDAVVAVKMEPQREAQSNNAANVHFQSLLRVFYQRLFPFEEFHRWLAYGDVQRNYFANREWSFTLASDAYIRFQSFRGAEDLKAEILRLCPVKIDIGAVYNLQPKDKKTVGPGAFRPLERELVFDIDMTDYDEIRTCCSGGDICRKCWDFMTIAIKILNRALKEDFGFKHLLWVYSGRRGVHCWISDDRARKMPPEGRRAIVSFLEVIKGGESAGRKVMMGKTFHPSLRRAYDVLVEHFRPTILEGMDVLGTKENWTKVLQLIPDEDIRTRLDKEWSQKELSSEDKWEIILQELKLKKKPSLNNVDRDIVFQYTYPRLDANVSIGLNHLLKSPFCIHPKTGRVCIPIDPDNCEKFDPLSVPTLQTLIDEINAYVEDDVKEQGRRKVADYQKTSLKPYIEAFKVFLSGIGEDIRRRQRAKQDLSF